MPTLNFEVLHLDCPIESTYMYLFDWALEHPDERANYVLDVAHQTAGRGQQGNSWYASEGLNLLPSFLVRFPRLFSPMVWALSELTALAVWHTVSSFLEDPTELRIKWPNDIYYKNRKLAGILIGHSLVSKRVDFSVIGIGLNVNEADFPPTLPNPISLLQINGTPPDLQEVRKVLYDYMGRYLVEVETLSPTINLFHLEYLDKLYRRDCPSTFRDMRTGQFFCGIIRDVQPDGRLVVMGEDRLRYFAFKEVEYVHSND